MNAQEKEFFDELSKDRSDSAKTLGKPSMRGVKKSVVEKYSDQAHFIYELLQNADDAHATKVYFRLEPRRLIFSHNGTRLFSVTKLSDETTDTENGTLGDINAITSIANSNKNDSSIGKFGIGFKAVFQYTSTPHIYDPNFRFRIERFIVPVLLQEDFPTRRESETLFVFPFDIPGQDTETAYSEIEVKLRNLVNPLLFLTSLEAIQFECNGILGSYSRKTIKNFTQEGIIAEKIYFGKKINNESETSQLWLFSRMDDHQQKYSVGFFLDEEGHLKSTNEYAYCFFPTKVVTGLNFIVHAPFLLTDSREGIRAGNNHNKLMVRNLAILASAAILLLRDIGIRESIRLLDDNIINIIPYDPNKFVIVDEKIGISFRPFYDEIKSKFETEELLPSANGYVKKENAYWATVQQLPKIFSNEQLSGICGNKDAQWVFPSLARDHLQQSYKPLCSYIDSLVRTNIDDTLIINGSPKNNTISSNLKKKQAYEFIIGITADFIKAQSHDWLHNFYKWLSETKRRTDAIYNKPIFHDQNNNAVAAYNEYKQLILFLPSDGVAGYTVVHPELLENPDTRRFIEKIGIKEPDLKDQIVTKILPLYKKKKEVNSIAHFLKFFEYFCVCTSDEADEFISLISPCEFLLYYYVGDSKKYLGRGNSLYFPDDELLEYFSVKSTTRFLNLDVYIKLLGADQEKKVIEFLRKLGVKSEIEVVSSKIDNVEEKNIDGCKEIVNFIVENQDFNKSILLWKNLLKIIDSKIDPRNFKTLEALLMGRRFRYRKEEYLESSDVTLLKENPWLMSRDRKFVAPNSINKNSLPPEYDTSSPNAQELLRFLSISDKGTADGSSLTDSQRQKIEFAEKLMAYGIEEADFEDFKEFKLQKAAKKKQSAVEIEQKIEKDSFEVNNTSYSLEPKHLYQEEKKIRWEAGNDGATFKLENAQSIESEYYEPDVEEGFTEISWSEEDYAKKIDQVKQKSEKEIDKITILMDLQNKAMASGKYSFSWFLFLLEMECQNNITANLNSREVSISFSKVEREQGASRTLVLKFPNRPIPQFIEDLENIPLILHFGEKTKSLSIEVASIKSYSLRVKLHKTNEVEDIDFSSVQHASISAKSPVFLLETLRSQFNELNFAPDYNLRENLCKNIEFIFGPPGTGKTTHLARNVLLKLMKENTDCKVLVLTPTNKAADVLVRRIMEVSGTDKTYEEWLVRFGTTGDEDIEQSLIYRGKTFDILSLKKSVTITTIARFPYDFFMLPDKRIYLNGIKWNYIVIDEASMIPIANIILPLYKKEPLKFIIAGDPIQIEPIASVDLWKNENIYTLIQLKSFKNPRTVPFPYKVELLETQFRSVPIIGEIFSKFSYDGILKHHRCKNSQRQLNVEGELTIKTINIIKFPVSKYESIYKPKRLLQSSSYQIYSVLFTYEYLSYFSRMIARRNPSSKFRIGVVSPYRAQAELIDKLVLSGEFPNTIEIQVGTIHGFQGDECDIMFVVLNTPPSISTSPEMFLNKRNILNVSISRARDYLFIIMPDEDTDNFSKLSLVNSLENLIKQTDDWAEVKTKDLERLMFNDEQHLEKNTFSTSHQNVNVYSLPEKYYEVRTEDNAVDIQVHKGG